MSNCHVSASFRNSIRKNKEIHTWLINMVIKFGARAVLLLFFPATANVPLCNVYSTCPLYHRKRHLDNFRMAAHGWFFVSKGWVVAWQGFTEHRHRSEGWGQASNQSLFLPHTQAEQETSDLSLLCFSRCCSPTGKWNTVVGASCCAF